MLSGKLKHFRMLIKFTINGISLLGELKFDEILCCSLALKRLKLTGNPITGTSFRYTTAGFHSYFPLNFTSLAGYVPGEYPFGQYLVIGFCWFSHAPRHSALSTIIFHSQRKAVTPEQDNDVDLLMAILTNFPFDDPRQAELLRTQNSIISFT